MITDPLFILAVLGAAIAASEWLARHTALRHLGSALLVIVLVAILANLRILPTYSDDIGVYRGVFEYLAPVSIVLLLLRVNLRSLAKAGPLMLWLFALGAAGTVAGALAGMWVVGGPAAFGEHTAALGGMFVGTYTGGSVNFNAIALEYGVVKIGPLYAGAAAVDRAATTLWMAATVAIPRWMSRRRPSAAAEETPLAATSADQLDQETIEPIDIALLIGLACGVAWISARASAWIQASSGASVPSVLILTTLALALAQLPAVQRLRGARVLGWIAVMFFLAVIGALCDVQALRSIGELGHQLIRFVLTVVAVHGLLVFGVGWITRADPFMVAVASQANIGGSTSALALARSLGRSDLMLPAILIGALGNGVGTYLGFLTATWLG